MSILDLWRTLTDQTGETFGTTWKEERGLSIPEPKNLLLGNEASILDVTVLYADLADSTLLVKAHSATFAGAVYKSYLNCAAKVIKQEGGTITSYDGDRIMAVWIGPLQENSAVSAGLQIEGAVRTIVQPALDNLYGANYYSVEQAVGIDCGLLHVVRVGVRGDNDLAWIGPAANYAAKFCSLREHGYSTFISERVYSMLYGKSKFSVGTNEDMWQRFWDPKTEQWLYKTSWYRFFNLG